MPRAVSPLYPQAKCLVDPLHAKVDTDYPGALTPTS